MSDSELARKTVSLDPQTYKAAVQRMRRLKYRKFSRYVADLIEKDIRERGAITIVRNEDTPKP